MRVCILNRERPEGLTFAIEQAGHMVIQRPADGRPDALRVAELVLLCLPVKDAASLVLAGYLAGCRAMDTRRAPPLAVYSPAAAVPEVLGGFVAWVATSPDDLAARLGYGNNQQTAQAVAAMRAMLTDAATAPAAVVRTYKDRQA